jgi:hypothetical protein
MDFKSTIAPARAGDAVTGAGACSLLGGVNRSESKAQPKINQAKSPAVAAAVADLKRNFTVEALRIVAVKASHAANDLEIGDDAAAERSIKIAISHLREGAAAFREMEAALEAGAAEIIAEAVRQ